VRALMAERTAVLDTLGIARTEGGWERIVTQTLPLARRGWRVLVAYRVAIDDRPVWAFFRTGDQAALTQALGTPPPYAEAGALTAHLDALVERSATGYPKQLDALLPRLQAQCAMPQPFEDLRAACTRTQDRWERRAGELETLAGLTTELAFQGYPDTFATARRLQRSVTLYVGPPNSGKTYAAFERLAQATK